MRRRKLLSLALLIILTGIMLCGCARKHVPDLVIASILDVPLKTNAADEHDLDFQSASQQVVLRYQGFQKGLEQFPDLKITQLPHYEDQNSENLIRQVREMAETDKVLMVIGSSTNMGSMHAAATTNFFEVPMLIPFAEGDYLIGDDNFWTLRLTPGGDDFANYLSSHLTSVNLMHQIDNIIFQDAPVQEYTVDAAVFYEGTTYGESAASELAQMLIDNKINIELYEKFTNQRIEDQLKDLQSSRNMSLSDIDIAFFINEDNRYAQNLMQMISTITESESSPIFIYYGTMLPEYREKEGQSDRLFFVHRRFDAASCPQDLYTYSESFGYGAGILVGRVLTRMMQNLPAWPKYSETMQTSESQESIYLARLRSEVRKQMILFDENVPCLGPVSFGSDGHNKNLELETVTFMDGGISRVVSDAEIVNLIANKVRFDLGKPND